MTAVALHGVIDGMPETDYHRHPALSSSGARKLLPPSCPAIFRHEQLNGQPPKRVFDVGHAAHALVLGVGAPIEVVQKTTKDGTLCDADDYRTKSATDHQAEIRAAGRTPLLRSEYEQVQAMAAALREHPVASALFDLDHGKAEQSLFWHDTRFGVDRRVRFDWLPDAGPGRFIAGDYKTAHSVSPDALAKSVADYGYYQQADYYLDSLVALGITDDPAFVFIAQMKTPPYLVTPFWLPADWLRVGRARNAQALELYAECLATDTWPGYADDDVLALEPPSWFTYRYGDLA